MKIELNISNSGNRLFYFLIAVFLMMNTTSGISQEDSLYQEYLKQNDVPKVRVNYFPIQYENAVDLIFYFDSEISRDADLTISIFDQGNRIQDLVVPPSQDYIVCNGLALNSTYGIAVEGLDDGQVVNYTSNLSSVSTATNTEVINLSDMVYNAIADWSAAKNQTQKLQDYILDIEDEYNTYELAYFLQQHYSVPYCTRPLEVENSVSDFFTNWPPSKYGFSDPNGDGTIGECEGVFTH